MAAGRGKKSDRTLSGRTTPGGHCPAGGQDPLGHDDVIGGLGGAGADQGEAGVFVGDERGVIYMEIEIGKYIITSDSLCVTLNEKKKIEKGENKGNEYLSAIGYFNTVESCLEEILQLKIKESQATSIKELLDEIKEISKFIREQFKKARAKG